jgi:hypothetical protein
MSWPAPWYDEQCVNADVVTLAHEAGGQSMRRRRDTAESKIVKRKRGGIFGRARLDLNERDDPPTPCDDIDFAARNSRAAREDSPATEA